MKKKEIRWVSRDADGRYDIWRSKPQKNKDGDEWLGGVDEPLDIHLDIRSGNIVENQLALKIKKGGLAKITMERMY